MKMDDGTVSVGAYDLVPILEEFIQEHRTFPTRVQGPCLHLPDIRGS